MNHSMPDLSVHHQLPEFTQTQVHRVGVAIQPSVVPFSSCPQSLPVSGSFPMSQLFAWGGQSIEVSASAPVLPMNIQDWSIRYDLNQIPYDYTVEVKNRFKWLDLTDRVTLYRRQWSRPFRIKINQKGKWLSEEALQIAVKRREEKAKEKGKYIPIWMQSCKE